MDARAVADAREGLQLVDVRHYDEWEEGRIEGARHIPVVELEEHVDELDRQRPVVTVCRSGSRSAEAADWLRSQGFDADSLEGGMEAWAREGLPFTTPAGEPGSVAGAEPPPDDRPEHLQRAQNQFLDTVFEVQDHFGDRVPSEEEVRAFLRDRLIAEGKTPAEAEEWLS